jgi:uroporphyrin-III C-methyltransferase / precorrin-2 dehydrogenase / sirohydrochlorin ferrochelatase
MKYFPIFLDLENRPVVIVGGGEEALRKARLFAKTQARLLVVAPALHDELAAMTSVTWASRRFEPGLLKGAGLVVSADSAVDAEVSAAAGALSIPVNVVDHPELSTFIVPSIVDRDPVVVAIGTEGTAPVLGQGLRARIDALLPQALGGLARAGAALRATAAERIPAGAARRGFWQRFFFGDVRESYLAGETAMFDILVSRILNRDGVAPRGRVSFVSAGPGNPELLTLKAQRKLQEADVIIHGATVPRPVLELARRDAVRRVAQGDFITVTAELAREAQKGLLVVRLVTGEIPTEELANLAADGVSVETVPGVGTLPSGDIVAFPSRDDIRDALLSAAS